MGIITVIIKNLTDDLLKEGEMGHCYVASEALYHLSGGNNSGLKPMNIKHEGSSHWFLLDGNKVIDITADQFKTKPDYSKARGRGFLTKQPSKRASILIHRVNHATNNL